MLPTSGASAALASILLLALCPSAFGVPLPHFLSVIFGGCPLTLPQPACSCERTPRKRGVSISCDLDGGPREFASLLQTIYQAGVLIEHLVIRDCTTPLGELDSMPPLPIYHLAIINCGLTGIKQGVLAHSATRLYRLDLSHNNVSNFVDTIHGLYQLKWLELTDNGITSIAPRAFYDKELLFLLNLNDNALDSLPSDVFARSGGIFSPPSRLTVLLAARNRLEKFPKELFKAHRHAGPTLPNLVYLDLSANNISGHLDETGTEVDFRRAPHLAVLKLANNRISSIEPDAFSNLPALEVLDLEGNELSVADNLRFDKLPSLRYFLASRNNITDFNTEMVPRFAFYPTTSHNWTLIRNRGNKFRLTIYKHEQLYGPDHFFSFFYDLRRLVGELHEGNLVVYLGLAHNPIHGSLQPQPKAYEEKGSSSGSNDDDGDETTDLLQEIRNADMKAAPGGSGGGKLLFSREKRLCTEHSNYTSSNVGLRLCGDLEVVHIKLEPAAEDPDFSVMTPLRQSLLFKNDLGFGVECRDPSVGCVGTAYPNGDVPRVYVSGSAQNLCDVVPLFGWCVVE